MYGTTFWPEPVPSQNWHDKALLRLFLANFDNPFHLFHSLPKGPLFSSKWGRLVRARHQSVGDPQRVCSHIGFESQAEMVKISQKNRPWWHLRKGNWKEKDTLDWLAKCFFERCEPPTSGLQAPFLPDFKIWKDCWPNQVLVGDRSALLMCTCQESVDHVHFWSCVCVD